MFLSQAIGVRIIDAMGNEVGKLADIIATPGGTLPRVSAIVISIKRQGSIVMPWEQVKTFEGRLWLLDVPEAGISRYEVREDDLWLARDVMDKQIVDVHDYRVVRVNDVRLEPSDNTLFLVGVDTGLRGLLRRLGIEDLVLRLTRRFRWRPHTHIIAWNEVETFEREEGRLRLKVSIEKLARLHPVDIAKIVNELDPAQRTEVFETLDVELAAETLPEADPEVQADIIESLEDERAADILEEMEPDEAADVLGDIPEERRQDILDEMEAEDREDVKELLEYDEETAGGLMTTEFIAVNRLTTAQEVIDTLRELSPEAETIYYIYVVDERETLVGVLSLRDLIVAKPDLRIEEFMVSKVIHVHLDASIQEIVKPMGDYNLLAIPVVDDENKLEGIITVDDALQRILPEDWRKRVPRVWSS